MSESKRSLPALTNSSFPGNVTSRTAIEKAAAMLALMDEKTLNTLSGKLSERHRDKLVAAVKSMRSVPQRELRRIAQEFALRVKLEKNAVRGGDDVAERLTSALFADGGPAYDAPQSADLDEMLAQMNQTPLWERVAKQPLKKLISYFEDKSATVLAIAMQQLNADTASELAGTLDDGLVRDAILLIAQMGVPNPMAVEAIEKMIESSLLAKKEADAEVDSSEGNPNADKVAGILNRLTNTRREKVLEVLKTNLEGEDMGEIAAKVLSFESLEYRLPRNAIPVIFREVAEKDLLVALKYAITQNDPVAEYLLGNISQRLAATYREKIEAMAAVDPETGEKAQSTVICKLLNIVEQGRIDLLAPEDERERSQPVEED